jgi:hypothetical protein
MGDRGNIFVKNGDEKGVYLYSHWGGSELPIILKQALSRQIRWGDASYLTRIIFDEMTRDRQGEELGFGISAVLTDNEHPIVVVDTERQVAFFMEVYVLGMAPTQEIPFREYILMDDAELLRRFGITTYA